jgi:iron complex outermembrane receptor protein
MPRSVVTAAALLVCAPLLGQPAQQPAPPTTQATIDVVGVTPVDGVGIDANQYPANVQLLTPSRNPVAADTLARRGVGLQLTETQANRFQPDLTFRGFLASPLLGVPQGIAVFQDGVRLNDPFGDVVHWDAVAEPTLSSIQLIPGSNATFGLNALGGVITLHTKTGFTDPGVSAEVGAGSFGAGFAGASAGWTRGSAAYFLALSHHNEDGWRDFAPSRLDHFFGSMQRTRGQGSSDLRLTAVDTALTGNGAAPVQLLEQDRAAVFTHPDETRNRALLISSAHNVLTRSGLIEVNAYARRTRTTTRNGDESPYERCDADRTFLCEADSDELILDSSGQPFRLSEDHPLDAVLNHSATAQTVFGTTAQLSRSFHVAGADHRATLGLALDRGTADFSLDAELADLTETRAAAGIGRIAQDSIVRLDAVTSTASAYLTDIISFTPRLTLTTAARFNRSAIHLRDRIGDDLSGGHRFTSFNPSLGVAFAARALTLFASVGQASRTPTPVELTCANPDDPCRLPNAFISDPPLDQVVARTIEIGVRGSRGHARWSIAGFRTANSDDILFISSGTLLGHGYFANVGRTLRTGLEADISSRFGNHLEWHAGYALLNATFDTDFTVASPFNPFAEDGEIHVSAGDRMPLIPSHTAKLAATLSATNALQLSAAARYASSAFFRGDEANVAAPLSGYFVADLGAAYSITPRFTVELAVTNAMNTSYETFGTFGDATEILGDQYDDARFVSFAQPRMVRLTLRLRK